MLIRVVLGVILVAHGLVHLLYLTSDAQDPSYPFTLEQSAIPDAARRPVAYLLLGATVAAFTLLGLAISGLPGLANVWAPLAIAAASASLALLIAFWDTRLLTGVAIDVVLVVIALSDQSGPTASQPEPEVSRRLRARRLREAAVVVLESSGAEQPGSTDCGHRDAPGRAPARQTCNVDLQAGQCDRDSVGPRVDRRPVAMVAKATAKGVEE